eukprot:GHUV01000527.1.p1 GENE.GHUV01000527.1~~GHUV01000527.1.p1  ORF type:complete len:224 (+),score=56.91 GHUV01000527.1:169-840(+)
MGFNDQPQTQGAYPNVPPQGYVPQGYPQPGNTAYPPMGATDNAYPPTGATNAAPGSSGVTAPGGYPAAPAAGPPDGRYIPEANKPQPAGYPNNTYPDNTYPPQGSAQGPATGYPVHHAAPPAGFMNIFGPHNVSTTEGNNPDEPCRCSIGWVLFAIGWFFPISWMVATFLPICTKSRNDRRAGIASSIMLIIYCVLVIALAVTQSRRGGYYGNNGYYNNGYNG